MDLSLEIRALLFILFWIVILTVLYLQLKYFRDRSDERIDAKLEREDLYNSMMTARAVCGSLRNQGYDVDEAETDVQRAIVAYEKRDHGGAAELMSKARERMMAARQSVEEEPFPVTRPVGSSDHEILRPKVSETAIQARFLIGRTRSSNTDDEVEALLSEAELALDAGEGQRGLSLAHRACRASEACPEEREDDGLCPDCGLDVPDEYSFCGACGKKVR